MSNLASLSQRLSLPVQDRDALSACPGTAAGLAKWLEALPKTNLGQTTRALFEAITELNHTNLTPVQRLQLLEVLRPAIYFAATGLRRHYLNQPIVLSEQAQKVTKLAQVLFHELATGYALVAAHTLALEKSGFSQPEQAIATALHRALTDTTQNVLRDTQLYRPVGRGTWHRLHQLATLAWEQRLEYSAVSDAQSGDCTLETTYLRALLLGCANTCGLRQDDLAKIFVYLPDWCRQVTLCGAEQGLFVIDPNSDEGPIYRAFHQTAAAGVTLLGLDTRALAEYLRQQRHPDEEVVISDQALSNDLLAHLTLNWSTASTRAYLRLDKNEQIEIALGLTATHHFCAGEIDFALLLSKDGYLKMNRPEDNPFLRVETRSHEKRLRDVWDSPFMNTGLTQIAVDSIDYGIRQQHAQTNRVKDKDKYHSFSAETVNISPAGFCLRWPPENPVLIRTGEIIGIRERNHKSWSVGAIRWVRITESGPQLGIELLSPTATPFGARVIQKAGPQGEFQRVLVLPEVKASGQPTTLITPRLPFRSGQKIALVHRDKETRVQLVRRIASSPAYSQFEFRRLGGVASGTETDAAQAVPARGSKGFDSLWDSL
jgi:hypothetical protein